MLVTVIVADLLNRTCKQNRVWIGGSANVFNYDPYTFGPGFRLPSSRETDLGVITLRADGQESLLLVNDPVQIPWEPTFD